MKLFVSLLLIISAIPATAQRNAQQFLHYPKVEFYSRIGRILMLKRPEEITQQMTITAGITAAYNWRVGKKANFIHIGTAFMSYRYITDGYFSTNNDVTTFIVTPADYKQHEIVLNYIQFPVQYKFSPYSGIGVGIGPYFGYLFESKQKFKLNNDKYNRVMKMPQPFQAGVGFDVHIMTPPGKYILSPAFGFGAAYQVTDHINQTPSFRPVSVYVTVGAGWW